MVTALITGITGQDGSYLAEFLLAKGYDVYGLVRRTSNICAVHPSAVHLLYGDLTDSSSLVTAIRLSGADEIYNLAAMSYVGSSWTHPVSTFDINACGVIRLLEAVRVADKSISVYQASSSEMFGNQMKQMFNEMDGFYPASPYAISKVAAHHAIQNYRESYNMFCCAGIAFNHESPRRGLEFVTRKITDGVARIKAGLQDTIKLGNVSARRDWGYAEDYVKAMWMMLQNDVPEDYVIATGESHSVMEFFIYSLAAAGLVDIHEDGTLSFDGSYLTIDSTMIRPTDVLSLCGDASKIKRELGWVPSTTFNELITMMVNADLKRYGL